ncbi:MAG TPA: class I SAM-dependent methyltransferase [Spirochaetia bacterium]|nr:class I SAM-dependent methyltransferase [Spirochaetia bacterium]
MSSPETNSKERFTSRVSDYLRYRPGYPDGVIACLKGYHNLNPLSVVADIGSGTGLLSELFLRNGNLVYAVEPNEAMRAAAEVQLTENPKFISVAGSAEETSLPDGSVDIVTAGQAFHWFDPDAARKEFVRILKGHGSVVLIWNARLTDTTPFLQEYEAFLKVFANDYAKVNHTNVEQHKLTGFFSPNKFTAYSYPNRQRFDLEGLKGRLRSSSYMPNAGEAGYEVMIAELQRLFERHVKGGTVQIDYRTNLYCGKLA